MHAAALLLLLSLNGSEEVVSSGKADMPLLKPWSARSHCPSRQMLNAASRHYLPDQLEFAFLDSSTSDRRVEAGLPAVITRSEIRRLNANDDFKVCEGLNRWFEANILYDADHVFDEQREQYVPHRYPMYYRIGNRYAILVSPYNGGGFEQGVPPPPIPGWVLVYVFDSNFQKIGQFTI